MSGNSAVFAFAAFAHWVKQGSFLTAWAVPPLSSCSCSHLYGRGTAVGPQSGERCWPLLARLWRAIAPLMKPWCAEGDVPTAANLHLYRGRSSHVGWHRDNEPLFGERGKAKLIVSVSFGSSAVFRWKGTSCPSNEGNWCWLGHGDVFGHCTDPGSDQERINITFRWVKQHVVSFFFKTGVACCLPTCARVFLFLIRGWWEKVFFLAFWLLLGTLCILVVLALLVITLVCARLGSQRCAFCCPWGVCWAAQKTACQNCERIVKIHGFKMKMLAFVGRPSVHSYNACMFLWVQGASLRNCRQKQGKTSFSPRKVFLFSRNSWIRSGVWYSGICGLGGNPVTVAIQVFNVGGWLTHSDLALDARIDFLAVVEHRLIPARVRSEWARLKSKGVASLWAPASQDSSHVGNAGVGVVSLRGADLSLPTFATAQFKRFFDCGRAVRCMLPLGAGWFMHLVVLYGYQGADADPEQLALTDHLFGVALGELSVVVRGQPCMLVGDCNVEPTKIPRLAKGISAGLWVDLEVSWALATGEQPASGCMRE